MATDLNGFANVNPGEFGISFFLDQGYKVRAINIDYDTCGGDNVYQSLSELERIITTIDGISYTFTVLTITPKVGYFHYIVQPVTIASTVTTSSIFNCVPANLIPSAEQSGFISSEYDVTINNATEVRTNVFAYDIDRTKSQVKPVNLLSILNDTATLAPVQESNYTVQGILNSRYEGTKTTTAEFGIDPTLSLRIFKGELMPVSTFDGLICSKSLDERDSEEYYYTQNEFYIAPNWLPFGFPIKDLTNLEKPNVRYTPAWESSLYQGNPSIGVPQISGVVVASISTTLKISGSRMQRIFPGDYLYMYNGNANPAPVSEYVKVKDRSYNATTKVMTYVIERNAFSPDGYTFTIPFSALQSDKCTLFHVVGDVIYASENQNTVYKVKDKKVYNEATKEIFLIDNRGQLVHRVTTCSI